MTELPTPTPTKPAPRPRPSIQARRPRHGLTLIAIRAVLAASQDPGGVQLTGLARAIGSPISTAQTATGSLIELGLLRRSGEKPPRYAVSRSRPVTDSLIEIAVALNDPETCIAIVLRANPSVVFASVDPGGFLVAVDETGPDAAVQALDDVLGRIRRNHTPSPRITVVRRRELENQASLDLITRHRVESGVTIVNRRDWLWTMKRAWADARESVA